MLSLAYSELTAPDASPSRWVVFLHGILGQGVNFRSFAKSIVAARPEVGALLVDLRGHGGSREGLEGPHGLDACADDLARLMRSKETRPVAVVGHSFGGKVACAYASRYAEGLEATVMIDSCPGPRRDRRGSEEIEGVLSLLRALPERFEDRDAFRAHVVEAGLEPTLAQWLAMSLEKHPASGGGWRFGLDLAVIDALLDDYFARDLWPTLDPPAGESKMHLVIAGRSNVFDEEERAQAETLAARHPSRVFVHELPEAGHWAHVDDPEGLARIVREALP